MKSVGIITVHRLPNWGSAMQGYALQHVIANLGYNCECIDYIYPNEWHIKRGSWIPGKVALKSRILRFFGLKPPRLNELIDQFICNEVRTSRRYSSFKALHTIPPIYDIYVSGSDQIWNWKTMCADPSYMLDFALEDKKRIAYSSSFSVDNIPEKYEELYRKNLSRYSAISVREKNGSVLVRKLLGREAPVVLDPTLLLPKEAWNKLSEKAHWKKKMPSKFILCYLLDYTYNPRPAMAALLYNLQKEYNYPVVLLGRDFKEFDGNVWHMKKSQGIGVYEFLWLVKNAVVFVTSSFHGTAFAVNIGTPFISMIEKRDQSDDRICSFLKSVKLENHIVTITDDKYDNLFERASFDEHAVTEILDKKRQASLSFLKNALDLEI